MVVSNLARCQHELGHDVLVLTPRIRGIDNHVAVPYRVGHYQRPSSKRFLTRQVLVRLLWEHFKTPLDVLHCHSAYPHGYVASTFSRMTGVPVVVTPHGPTDIMRAERIRRSPKLEKRLALGLRMAAGITAISNNIFEEILSIGEISEEKVHIIPNGVNLADFRDVEPYKADYPYFMAMGRMVPQKGFDRLLVSFAKVADQLGDLRLLMAGEGVNRRDYESLAKKLGIENRVQFLGLVQGAEKIRLLKGARFFVCPSRFEPFGIVVLEAMAAGLPVLANRVGGIPDIIEEGVQGILTDPDLTEEMGLEIVTMNNSPDWLAQMSKAALERASSYDWSAINEMYLEVYEKGLGSKGMNLSSPSENSSSMFRFAERGEGGAPR
jgi:glycosyltransferase involved in cell wall biosynthesis